LQITTLRGSTRWVDDKKGSVFEIPESQAREWAKERLGEALGEIRGSIDEKLAEWRGKLEEFSRTPVAENASLTPNAAPALLSLLKRLPGILGGSLSGDGQRLDAAREAMAGLQRRLKDAGIDLDERFSSFPDRLARLREEIEQERAAKRPKNPDSGDSPI
jgi:hypothetical protein